MRRTNSSTGMDGQKAVCLDSGLAPPSGLCVIYSFGLSDDRAFDTIMESYGCDVYAFDPAFQPGKEPGNKTRHVHHFNLALGVNNTKKGQQGKINSSLNKGERLTMCRQCRLADGDAGKHPKVPPAHLSRH